MGARPTGAGRAPLGAAHGEIRLEEKANRALTSRAKQFQELSSGTVPYLPLTGTACLHQRGMKALSWVTKWHQPPKIPSRFQYKPGYWVEHIQYPVTNTRVWLWQMLIAKGFT